MYKPDLNKDCHLVGFNLGNSCNRLANVCILHKACSLFDTSCGMVNRNTEENFVFFVFFKGCVTGRRFIQDASSDYKTLIIGGVKDKRLKAAEYETSIEMLDNTGKSKCSVPMKTQKREGAAGAYISSVGK